VDKKKTLIKMIKQIYQIFELVLTTAISGKEAPYLKIGDKSDHSTKGSSDYVWALNT